MKSKRERYQVQPNQMLLSFSIATLLLAAIYSVKEHRQDGTILGALQSVLTSSNFWANMILPIAVMYLLMTYAFPPLFRWLIKDPQSGKLSWHRNRLLATVGAIVFLAVTAIPLYRYLSGDRTLPADQIAFIAVIWVAYIAMILSIWLNRNPDRVKAFETGNLSRFNDERYQTVVGKSAVQTLYIVMGLLLIVGTLYDTLVTRVWPVRSLLEVVTIYSIWHISYRRWSSKL